MLNASQKKLAKGLVAAVLLFVIARIVGTGEFLDALGRLPLWLLAAGIAAFTIDRLLMAYKWLGLLRPDHGDLELVGATQIYCASMLWGLALPSTAGADAVRAGLAAKRGVELHPTLASIYIERVIGLLGTGSFACIAALWLLSSGRSTSTALAILFASGAVVAVATAMLLLVLNRRVQTWLAGPLSAISHTKIRRWVEGLVGAASGYRSRGREMLTFFGLTLLEQFIPVLITWTFFLGLGESVSLPEGFFMVSVSYLVSRLPISIGGIGVYEGSLVGAAVLIGTSPAEAFAVGLATRAIQILTWLPWWAASSLQGGRPESASLGPDVMNPQERGSSARGGLASESGTGDQGST